MPDTNATPTTSDRIEKHLLLNAPRSRVWRAITDVKQFNAWFGVELTSEFTPGAEINGQVTTKNFEHVTMTIWIEAMQPETFFSFSWHPNAITPGVDYSSEPKTLVTFTLADDDGGTKLTIVESGFDAIPESRRAAAFAGNSGGWFAQLENIRKYLAE